MALTRNIIKIKLNKTKTNEKERKKERNIVRNKKIKEKKRNEKKIEIRISSILIFVPVKYLRINVAR